MPRVMTYTIDPECAASVRPGEHHIARIQVDGRLLPAQMVGSSREVIADEMHKFWVDEVARFAKARAEKKGAARVVSPDDDIHMIDGHGPMTTAQEAQFAPPAEDDLEDLFG